MLHDRLTHNDKHKHMTDIKYYDQTDVQGGPPKSYDFILL